MPEKYRSAAADSAKAQYARLMEEIKRRNRAMTEMLAGTVPPQPQIIVSDFCYLQLRLTCELIVLACAVAHGDVRGVEGRKLQKEWHAADLATKLEQLHPEFYPKPGQQVLRSNGKVERIDPISDGFLALPDLKALYSECGDRLHIGSVRTLLTDRRPPVDLARIRNWQDKIIRLLNHHQIQLFDPDYQLWTIMQGKEDGQVHVTLFQRIGEAPPAPLQRL